MIDREWHASPHLDGAPPRWRRRQGVAYLQRAYCLEARFECWEEMEFAARNPRLHSLGSGKALLLGLGLAGLALAFALVVYCVCRSPTGRRRAGKRTADRDSEA